MDDINCYAIDGIYQIITYLNGLFFMILVM